VKEHPSAGDLYKIQKVYILSGEEIMFESNALPNNIIIEV
jgi:hypothetical protein